MIEDFEDIPTTSLTFSNPCCSQDGKLLVGWLQNVRSVVELRARTNGQVLRMLRLPGPYFSSVDPASIFLDPHPGRRRLFFGVSSFTEPGYVCM
jgi:hypothetical protein